MKLRQLPEDFIVEEKNDIHLLDKGPYKLFILEKKGMETFALLSYLSKQNNIPIKELGIAGLKDKHAMTRQYLTIPAKYELNTKNEKNFSLKFKGFAANALDTGDLFGNRFEITVRALRKGELDRIYERAKTISTGVPNYFDSQRFGSVINNEFIAKYLVKKQYDKAVKIFLTGCSKFESQILKQQKRLISENWKDLSKIEGRINTITLQKVIAEYLRTKDWLCAYKQIPANLREMYVSAYQSYLWNECIKELLKKRIDKSLLYHVPYNAGSLIFYRKISDNIIKNLPKSFKTISHDMAPNAFEREIIDLILAREGLKLQDFDIKQKTGSFFKMHEREAFVTPIQFTISPPVVDELNHGRGSNNTFKVKVSFTLPKGSYATVIIKKIFV
jgi:tRNA pseudouridine13 synthase